MHARNNCKIPEEPLLMKELKTSTYSKKSPVLDLLSISHLGMKFGVFHTWFTGLHSTSETHNEVQVYRRAYMTWT